MALIHRATITPTKLELIAGWLPNQSWYEGDEVAPTAIGAYRFDDPDGEVGIETHLVRVGDGPVLQVPLTYRGGELPGADDALVGTTEHSVLGRRWVYDACGDPVYATALAAVLFRGGEQAVEHVVDSEETRRPSVVVRGSGQTSAPVAYSGVEYASGGDRAVCTVADADLEVLRVIDPAAPTHGDNILTGRWDAQAEPVLLARGQRQSRSE